MVLCGVHTGEQIAASLDYTGGSSTLRASSFLLLCYNFLNFQRGNHFIMPDKKLNINQKTVLQLFDDKGSFFLIPDYQRPYAWTDEECSTLWNDLCTFACPEEDYANFNPDDEYFLGSIVIFRNKDDKFEVIDGQQRLITILLMLRAFYKIISDYIKTSREDTKKLNTALENIGKCIWQTNEFGDPDTAKLKIDSLVAADEDREELISVLRDGSAPRNHKSRYAKNYRFYLDRIKELQDDKWLIYLPIRTLNNCILFPIEAGNQNTALRIFSTLNDRGKPLSDSDIFKVQLYKAFSGLGKRKQFMNQWKELEALCEKIFSPRTGTPLDELFRRYMYYLMAKNNVRDSTILSIRGFYERQDYRLFREESEYTFANLKILANFWNDVYIQNETIFSDRVLKRLFVLNFAPNAVWSYMVSVYFMHHKQQNGTLEEEAFYNFLNKITAFIFGYSITALRVDTLRTPAITENINIVNDLPVTFSSYKFDLEDLKYKIKNYKFSGAKKITRSMLAWRAFQFKGQELLPITSAFDAEHICSQFSDVDGELYESLGNKSFIERKIRDIAKVFDFKDKRKYYLDFLHLKNKGTQIFELRELALTRENFTKQDIIQRNREIVDSFITFLKDNNLIK